MSNEDVASMDVLEFDVEEMIVLSNPDGQAVVDEVSQKGDDIVVYVSGDVVEYNSPPRKLNEKMLEHGYSYVDWVMNGTIDDNRAMFKYTAS